MYKLIFTLILAFAAGYFFFDFTSDVIADPTEIAEETGAIREWKTFEPASGKFSVKMPSIPQYAIDVANAPNTNIKRWYEIYASEELDGTVCMVNLITYHPDFDLSNVKELLHNVVNEMVSSNPHNHLLTIKDIAKEGRDGVAFHIENHALEVEGETFLVGSTVYLLAYTATKTNFDESEFNTFINSFKVLKEEKFEESAK